MELSKRGLSMFTLRTEFLPWEKRKNRKGKKERTGVGLGAELSLWTQSLKKNKPKPKHPSQLLSPEKAERKRPPRSSVHIQGPGRGFELPLSTRKHQAPWTNSGLRAGAEKGEGGPGSKAVLTVRQRIKGARVAAFRASREPHWCAEPRTEMDYE